MAARLWEAAVARANSDAKQPVVFLEGGASAASAWVLWAELFEAAGYVTVTGAWPTGVDPTAAAAELLQALSSRPAVVGHGFGGRLAWRLACEGLSAATVAIAPERGATLGEDAAEPRGPLLVIAAAGDGDAAAGLGRPGAATELVVLPGRGEWLAAGPGWREAAEAALSFIQRFV